MRLVDAHIHCGDNQETKAFTLEQVQQGLAEAGAQGAVIFAFPEDMYRLVDTPQARRRANAYVLQCATRAPDIYPFYFVWNDYELPDDLAAYAGIKWHRHADEPRYDYQDPKCEAVLEAIRALRLPVTLEEEFDLTVDFVNRNPGLPIIIPHTGLLNGGTERMDVFFDNPDVYFDTSMASPEAISHILEGVGARRVIFGSDVSGTSQPFFNFTKVELAKLDALDLSGDERRLIYAENIDRLVAQTAGKYGQPR